MLAKLDRESRKDHATMATDQYPNFDFIRLVAATSVIFSHSFLLAEGTEQHEPFVMLLGPKNILGIYGVFVFFIISGYLISGSIEKSNSLRSFLWKRALRIYPGLLICTLTLGLLVVPFFSSAGPDAFLRSGLGLQYALSNVAWPGADWRIETVAFYDRGTEWLAEVINGSLWTIPYEILCYISMAILAALRMNRVVIMAGLFALIMGARYFPGIWDNKTVGDIVYLAPSFIAGTILWHFRNHLCKPVAVVGVVGAFVAAYYGASSMLFPLFASYPLLYVATSQRIRLPKLDKIGDLSFGLYLYGWPAGQLACAYLGDKATWWSVWGLSMLMAAPVAYLSWHLVEKPMLALKRHQARGSARVQDAALPAADPERLTPSVETRSVRPRARAAALPSDLRAAKW